MREIAGLLKGEGQRTLSKLTLKSSRKVLLSFLHRLSLS